MERPMHKREQRQGPFIFHFLLTNFRYSAVGSLDWLVDSNPNVC